MKKKADIKGKNWNELLIDAVKNPGIISECYRAFHNYSTGNGLLAADQLIDKGLPISPISTFKDWKEKGRTVKKGEKALFLCMPVSAKAKKEDKKTGEEKEINFKRFIFVPRWFALSQTEGEEFKEEDTSPEWNKEKALDVLGIDEVNFSMTNGNVQGYASGFEIAINPLAALPHKTRFHELAHVVLGHTSEGIFSDSEATPTNIKEVEAESVAFLCCQSLEMAGGEESRGYIQSWLKTDEISKESAQKIFSATNKILKAGV